MKQLILTIALVTLTQLMVAQKVQYSYDNHGNRTQRKLVVNGPFDPMRFANIATENIADGETVKNTEGISVYPNPTSDKIILTINDFNPSETNSMTLLDAKGNEVMTQKVTQNNTEMSVAHLRAGVYYFKVIKDKNMLYYKLVKVD